MDETLAAKVMAYLQGMQRPSGPLVPMSAGGVPMGSAPPAQTLQGINGALPVAGQPRPPAPPHMIGRRG